MPFKIHRINDDKGTTDIAPPEYATGEGAFRAAMDNVTQFITDHWDAAPGDGDIDGPPNNNRFKIYINRRPGGAEIEMRYDYVVAPDNFTNSIYWRIVSI